MIKVAALTVIVAVGQSGCLEKKLDESVITTFRVESLEVCKAVAEELDSSRFQRAVCIESEGY